MVTGKDIEAARRVYIAARGTPREDAAHVSLKALVEQAKREHVARQQVLS